MSECVSQTQAIVYQVCDNNVSNAALQQALFKRVTERILQKAENASISSDGRKWTRDDLYDRSL